MEELKTEVEVLKVALNVCMYEWMNRGEGKGGTFGSKVGVGHTCDIISRDFDKLTCTDGLIFAWLYSEMSGMQ